MAERILILDDEEGVTELLEKYLSSREYECVSTTSPHEALDLLQRQEFALLLTDLRMPKMDGIEVLRQAREIVPDVAVVVVTALTEITNAIKAMRLGADDYVLKPFNLSEISLAVSRTLEKRQLLLENRAYQEELTERVDAATQDLERVNLELRETKQYLENLLNSTVDAIITIDTKWHIDYANAGALHMFGHGESELVGLPAEKLFANGADEVRYIERVLKQGRPLQNYESELVRRGGAAIPVNMTITRVRGADGEVVSTLAICKDITEQKRLEQELKEMSIKDSLTGLYNQGYFYDRLDAEIERARRQQHPLSLLLFDVDGFKGYNDGHGHLEGDKVLKAVARVIVESTRDHVDIGFRYGGDEFTVILPEADAKQAETIAQRVRQAFKNHRFDHLTLSIGLMAYREGYSLRTFIQFTDAMMYDAKRAGGDRVCVFSAGPGSDRPKEEKESL